MVKEYRVSLGTKITHTILALILLAVPGFGFVATKSTYILPLFVLFGGLGALLVYTAFRRKIVLDDSQLQYTSAFSQKSILFSDIKGFRIASGKTPVLRVVSAQSEIPDITINNYIEFKDSDDFIKAFTALFTDLDATDLEAAKEALLHDEQLGPTEEQRLGVFQKAKRTVLAYNIIGFILILFEILLPDHSGMWLALIYPLIGLPLLWFSKGLIKFWADPRSSPYPSILLGFTPSCFVLLFHSLLTSDLLDTSHLWLPAILCSAILSLLIYKAGIIIAIRKISSEIIIILLVALPYGFGFTYQVNGARDTSHYYVYEASVVQHYKVKGKSTSYFVTLGPWGPRTAEHSVEIGGTLFSQIHTGDTVEVVLHQGLLGIPWFKIRPVTTIIDPAN
jgi:hypothetical protein